MREQALAVKFAEQENNLGGGARNLPDLEVGDMVQIQNQKGNDPKRWNKSGKIIEKLDFDQYLVKIDGGVRLTRRNRRFLKKIISTLADREMVESEGIDGDNQDRYRRSSRLVERNGGDVQSVEISGGDKLKGGDKRWRQTVETDGGNIWNDGKWKHLE